MRTSLAPMSVLTVGLGAAHAGEPLLPTNLWQGGGDGCREAAAKIAHPLGQEPGPTQSYIKIPALGQDIFIFVQCPSSNVMLGQNSNATPEFLKTTGRMGDVLPGAIRPARHQL
ncbi:hypothetical protein ACRAWG_35155 [Methylobacterium sp. P31]